MHDIRFIRENPGDFDAHMTRRGLGPQSAAILDLDTARRAKIAAAETAQADRNAASKEVAKAKASGDEAEFERLRALIAAKKDEIAALEDDARTGEAALNEILMGLPNLLNPDVPEGADEADNTEVRTWGEPRKFNFAPKEHFDLPATQNGMDFETAAKLSGARFVILSGAVARLHRALAQFMLDTHITEHGLIETNTPVLVRNEAMIGTGQLPKFSHDSFFGASMNAREKIARNALEDFTTKADLDAIAKRESSLADIVIEIMERAATYEDFWLIPTSEVTLTNLVSGLIVDEGTLPRRYAAHSLCFRSEAGSAGKDTAGMLRQHQFEKVEMVSVTHPDTSWDEHDRMTACAEAVLEKLGLPYRTVILCTGDIGFGALKTHDIEVWLPGQARYREISSVSNCGDFQARRMNARFRPQGGGRPEFLNTLNGSGVAVGRALIAVLENGQQEDGSVVLPDVLAPYLGGASGLSAGGELTR